MPRHSYPAACPGFLSFPRNHLAIASLLLSAALSGVNSLPASAATVPEVLDQPAPQSVVVPAAVAPPPATRPTYGVTEFDLVQWPVPSDSPMASDFGYRSSPCGGCSSNHLGIDLNPDGGTPIEAIADGVVREVGSSSSGLGVYAMIDHVIDGREVTSVYAHMQYGSLALTEGEHVGIGQLVGRVGSTGASTGNHLHFEIRFGGDEPVDPREWLQANVTN